MTRRRGRGRGQKFLKYDLEAPPIGELKNIRPYRATLNFGIKWGKYIINH